MKRGKRLFALAVFGITSSVVVGCDESDIWSLVPSSMIDAWASSQSKGLTVYYDGTVEVTE